MAELTAGALLLIENNLVRLARGRNYALGQMTRKIVPPGHQKVQINALASRFTVNSDGSSDVTPDDPSLATPLDLLVDKEPLIAAKIRRRYEEQMLGGGGQWQREISEEGFIDLANYLDRELWSYIFDDLIDSTSGYMVNATQAALTLSMILQAKAKLMKRGARPDMFKLFVDSWAARAIELLPTFVGSNQQVLQVGPNLAPQIGTIAGVPVFETTETLGAGDGTIGGERYNTPCTAVTIATNVATVTATDHNLLTGNKVTISGITTPLTTAAAITKVNANSFTVPLTAVDGAMADGTGTVYLEAAVNMMVDSSYINYDIQSLKTSFVEAEKNTGGTLKISPLWGMVGRSGRAVAILSPYQALS